MTFADYHKTLLDALGAGRIDEDTYSSALDLADIFCDDEEDDDYDSRLPQWYAEIDYGDREDAESILGSRWDDMNYLHYMER